MLGYPFRAGVRGWLLGLVLASVLVQFFTGPLRVKWLPRFEVWSTPEALAFGVVGVGLEAFWWLVAFKLAVEGMRAGARGSRRHSTRDDWIDDEQAFRHLLLWGGVLLTGYVLYLQLGGVVLGAYAFLLVGLLPAVLVLLGMNDDFGRALNPGEWRAFIARTGAAYVLAAAKIVLLVVLAGVLQALVIPRDPRWLSVPLSHLAWLFVLFAGYHELGRMLDFGPRVKAPAEAPKAVAPTDLTEKETLALGAAARLLSEQRYARGSLELAYLAGRAGTSAQVHGRYRELLVLARDEAGLLRHAQSYVPELLSLGHESEALALYEESLAMDPAFELAEPARITQLLQALLREHKEEVAIPLALQFLRRFPDEADAVPEGLAVARLLDRHGSTQQARELLADLVGRFPAHPMRGEMAAALETIEQAVRRG